KVVDHQLDEDRVDNTNGRGQEDCGGDDSQPSPIWPEEAHDAAQGSAPATLPALQVRLEAAPVAAAAHHGSPATQSIRIERNACAAGNPTASPASRARSRTRSSTASQSSNWLAWQRSAASAVSRCASTSTHRFACSAPVTSTWRTF